MTESVILSEKNSLASERKQDTVWMLNLFGAAIGAGILFLPIDAGLSGILPLIIMALIAFPMTHFSHRALCRFVLSGTHNHNDITEVATEHFGIFGGNLLTLLYFFAIYPVVLMYCVALTNTTQSFIVNQLGLNAPPRYLVSLILVLSLMFIVRLGQDIVIKAVSYLVYPFIISIIFISIYLVPYWNTAVFHHINFYASDSTSHGLLSTIWLMVPVIVFSFNHTCIISSFAVSQKSRFTHNLDAKCSKILRNSHILMFSTVMIFVFSCVLSLSPQDLALAKQQNISILSYLANHFDTPFIAYAAPIIAFVAISKSFFGHYLGAKEGLNGLLVNYFKTKNKDIGSKTIVTLIEVFMAISGWIIATVNPNILKIIETLGGPVIAMLLFLMPMYAIANIPALKKYKSKRVNGFVTIMGLITISAIFYGLLGK